MENLNSYNKIGLDKPVEYVVEEVAIHKLLHYIHQYQQANSSFKFSSRDRFQIDDSSIRIYDVATLTEEYNDICESIGLDKYKVTDHYNQDILKYIKDKCEYFLCIIR